MSIGIAAEVVADSISPANKRITTFRVNAHRFVLAEINTHRMLTRNWRSSRAVPTERLIAEVRDNPAMPVFWGKNQKGMQAAEELDDENVKKGWLVSDRGYAKNLWKAAAVEAARAAKLLSDAGAHKQIVNRVLEPFLYVPGVITATEYDNFFGLRLHSDTQPEMRALAVAMWEARKASEPKKFAPGEWHLPFITDEDRDRVERDLAWHMTPDHCDGELIRVSVARCARVSYESFETGKRSTVEEDLRLYERLVGSQPLHASPAEHQATPDSLNQWYVGQSFKDGATCPECGSEESRWNSPEEHGNFVGWRQYRKMLPGEPVAPLPAEYRA